MFGRKNKSEPEQGRDRRQVERTGGNPTFSYYNNRAAFDTKERRTPGQQPSITTGKSRRLPRSLAQTPFWILLAIATICLVKVLFLSTDPKVVVLGNTAVSTTYLQPTDIYAAAAQQQLSSSITSHSKLTVNLGGTATALEQRFPELEAVSMTVPLVSSRPIIYVQIAQPSLVLQTGRGNFALNKAGFVLAKLRVVPSGVPLVVDQSGGTPTPGKQYLPGSTVAFAQTVAYQFAAAKLAISSFVLPSNNLYELDVRLEGQPYSIRCDLQGDALAQSGAALATLQRLSGGTPGQYVDVRVPDRVYYK